MPASLVQLRCPRCGADRWVQRKTMQSRARRKVRGTLCQPCASGLTDKRRNMPLMFRLDEKGDW